MAVARKYGMISFEEARDHLVSILQAKEGRLADFGASAYGKTLIELFAGQSDLMAYYAESAFENAFLESAVNSSAVYAGARMLGYSVRRPVPAKAGIGFRLTKSGIYDTVRVYIPKGTVFTMSARTLTAVSDMEFAYDRATDEDSTGMMRLVSGVAVLAEGVFQTEALISNGQQNQVFYINDPTFADYFGENDPNYADDGHVTQRASCFTTVTSDATLVDNVDPNTVKNDRLYWRISRRGLIDPSNEDTANDIQKFADGDSNFTTNYTVIVGTSNDGGVELRFGDGLESAIPYGDVIVRYFSTSGEDGNLLGVEGTTLSVSGGGIRITQANGKESDLLISDLDIFLTTDIRGGLNIESIDSIKANASQIYNSLDRLVTRSSYKTFLRRYADVKYASAYGEDILNTKLPNGGINVKYMNQIRFSALKDLYREKDGKYYPTAPSEYFLGGFKVNGLMNTWEYDYEEIDSSVVAHDGAQILAKINAALSALGYKGDELSGILRNAIMPYIPTVDPDGRVFGAMVTPMDYVVDGSELHSIMVALNRRSMVTLGGGYHNFVFPTVHNMSMHMDVTLFKGNNFTDVREKITKAVYKFLKDNTEFCSPIYRSRIASIVHTMPEVAGVDVTFTVPDNGYGDLELGDYPWLGVLTSDYVSPGTVTFDGPAFALEADVTYDGVTASETFEFTLPGQKDMQSRLSYFYTTYVKPNAPSDRTTDKYVGYIWSNVMQQVYSAMLSEWTAAKNSGDVKRMTVLNEIMNTVKTWSMEPGADELTFKDGEHVKNLHEVDGSALFDYLLYGMNYIKLVRNILCTRTALALIDPETGNITNYTNDNEIVQFNIPNEEIELTVAYESSLLTK
ncbi:hypothetical protein [Fibrobacter succinogenes]|uniref:hypothetical protein n=1 Tax=Fibrobacter succinogenes TaxID=833 RepID=UPI001569A1DC|nr:hypothetical protein [Fibrobacter succinogenes]